MKRFYHKAALCATFAAWAVSLAGCRLPQAMIDIGLAATEPAIPTETQEIQTDALTASIITEHNWNGTNEDSLIVCETDGTFKYYRYATDLTDNYYDGTYEFFVGADAVEYVTTTLSDYGITEAELQNVFLNSEEYDEDNFICLVLNNEKCIIDGENQVDEPYRTPYYGFCLEADGLVHLDIVNMNSGNYHLFVSD